MGRSALCSRRSFNLDAHPRSPCWDEHTRPLSSSSWASWSLASSDSAFRGGNKRVGGILWEPRDRSDENTTPQHRSSDVWGCPGDPTGGHTSYGSALSRAGRARQNCGQSCTTPGQIFGYLAPRGANISSGGVPSGIRGLFPRLRAASEGSDSQRRKYRPSSNCSAIPGIYGARVKKKINPTEIFPPDGFCG